MQAGESWKTDTERDLGGKGVRVHRWPVLDDVQVGARVAPPDG